MNRRDFLKISSVATFSMLFGDFKMIEAKNFSGKIDFHAHAILPSYIEGLKKLKIDAQAEEGFPLPKWSVEEHLKFMDDAGIDFTILSMATPHIYNGKKMKNFPAKLQDKLTKNLRRFAKNFPKNLDLLRQFRCRASKVQFLK